MEQDREKMALERQLATCRRLANEFTDGVTAQNLRELAAELEHRLRALDNSPSRDHGRLEEGGQHDRNGSEGSGLNPAASPQMRHLSREGPLHAPLGLFSRLDPQAAGTLKQLLNSTRMPKEIAITLWSLVAACLLSFGVVAAIIAH
jgi:hypothetical protein